MKTIFSMRSGKRGVMAIVVALSFCISTFQPAFCGERQDHVERVVQKIQDNLDRIQLGSEATARYLSLLDGKIDPKEKGWLQTLDVIHELRRVSQAVSKDKEDLKNGTFRLRTSATVEALLYVSVNHLDDIVDALKDKGRLPATFKLPKLPPVVDLAVAIKMHTGRGNADIETITQYVDGIHQVVQYFVVFSVTKNHDLALVYSSLADVVARLFRGMTQRPFDFLWIKLSGQDKQLLENWRSLQIDAIYRGRPVQRLTDLYGEQTLSDHHISRAVIKKLDAVADFINSKHTAMIRDWSIDKIEVAKIAGQIELAGIKIRYSEAFRKELNDKTPGVSTRREIRATKFHDTLSRERIRLYRPPECPGMDLSRGDRLPPCDKVVPPWCPDGSIPPCFDSPAAVPSDPRKAGRREDPDKNDPNGPGGPHRATTSRPGDPSDPGGLYRYVAESWWPIPSTTVSGVIVNVQLEKVGTVDPEEEEEFLKR